ncbi:MAG: phosphoribosyl-AMP cyclohydrolase [Pseudomonadota bacterium]
MDAADTTTHLTPKYGADGLITAIAQDHRTGAILMVAHMNAEALAATLAERRAVYWSRSRQSLWRKGETSGHTQKVQAIYIDCDQDAVILAVEQTGAACHTGRPSCFYRVIEGDDSARATLRFVEEGAPHAPHRAP